MCFTWGIPLRTRQAPLTLAGGRGIDFSFVVPDFAVAVFSHEMLGVGAEWWHGSSPIFAG